MFPSKLVHLILPKFLIITQDFDAHSIRIKKRIELSGVSLETCNKVPSSLFCGEKPMVGQANEQFFSMVLFMMLYKVVLTFESVDKGTPKVGPFE